MIGVSSIGNAPGRGRGRPLGPTVAAVRARRHRATLVAADGKVDGAAATSAAEPAARPTAGGAVGSTVAPAVAVGCHPQRGPRTPSSRDRGPGGDGVVDGGVSRSGANALERLGRLIGASTTLTLPLIAAAQPDSEPRRSQDAGVTYQARRVVVDVTPQDHRSSARRCDARRSHQLLSAVHDSRSPAWRTGANSRSRLGSGVEPARGDHDRLRERLGELLRCSEDRCDALDVLGHVVRDVVSGWVVGWLARPCPRCG